MTDTIEPIEWPAAEIEQLLETVELAVGHHTNGEQACAMDLLGMAIEGEWTDTLKCVHPTLSKTVHRINDASHTTPEARRRIVLEAGPLLIGTAGDVGYAALVAARAGQTVDGLIEALKCTQRGAVLSGAVLRGADLRSADLSYADLRSADLSYADLSYADLRGADLSGDVLSGAVLRGAVLSGADLRYAVLSGAVLSGAVLSGADLRSADLRGCDLHGADLHGAALGNWERDPNGYAQLKTTS